MPSLNIDKEPLQFLILDKMVGGRGFEPLTSRM